MAASQRRSISEPGRRWGSLCRVLVTGSILLGLPQGSQAESRHPNASSSRSSAAIFRDEASGHFALALASDEPILLTPRVGRKRGYDFSAVPSSFDVETPVAVEVRQGMKTVRGHTVRDSTGLHLVFDTITGRLPTGLHDLRPKRQRMRASGQRAIDERYLGYVHLRSGVAERLVLRDL